MATILNFDNEGGSAGGLQKSATFSKKFTLQSDCECSIDLTGYTAKMQVRQNFAKTVILELSTTNGRILITPDEGLLELNVSATDTALLPAGKYIYDLYLISADEIVTKLFQGEFVIYDSVTIL